MYHLAQVNIAKTKGTLVGASRAYPIFRRSKGKVSSVGKIRGFRISV